MPNYDIGDIDNDSIVALFELSATSDHTLLTKAADIIEKDPVIARGTFREMVRQVLDTTSRLEVPAEDLDKPCHCLIGAVREAGGVYQVTPDSQYATTRYRVETAMSRRMPRIFYAIASCLDLTKLAKEIGLDVLQEHIRTEQWDMITYDYSDRVIHQMGTEGPAEAARVLRAAAAAINPPAPTLEVSA